MGRRMGRGNTRCPGREKGLTAWMPRSCCWNASVSNPSAWSAGGRAGMASSRIAAPLIRGAAIRDPCRRLAGHPSRHASPAGPGRDGRNERTGRGGRWVSAAYGVALHAAGVGGGVEDAVAAGHRADPAKGPGGADVDQVAAAAQFGDHRGAGPRLDVHG